MKAPIPLAALSAVVVVVLALVVMLPLALVAAEPFQVAIKSPGPGDVAIGKVEIAVEVVPPEGTSILKVELFADDRLITTLLDPPWKFTWDAGDSLRSRTIRARAYASNGLTAGARVTTQALKGAQRAHVTLVQVYCTVRDEQGSYLTDLKKEDFSITESGKTQEIAVFSSERKPVRLVLLIDTSASMKEEGRIDVAREAAAGFIDALEKDDEASLVAFSDLPQQLVKSSADKQALAAAVGSIEAKGGTALYDAIITATGLLKAVEGKKAIILLSDGRDESVDGLGPGSFHTFDQALDEVLRTEVAVYAIGTGDRLEEQPDFEHRRTVGEILSTLADRSGGRAYFIRKASKLKDAYRRIEDELRHQYTLAYYPPAESDGGATRWRPITVRVSRPRARITARSGYYAR